MLLEITILVNQTGIEGREKGDHCLLLSPSVCEKLLMFVSQWGVNYLVAVNHCLEICFGVFPL